MFCGQKSLNILKVGNNCVLKTWINGRTLSDSSSSKSSVDSVSPSHPISNLRLIRFGRHPKETQFEKEFRNRRIKVQEWNHNYWLKNNKDFQREKSEFIKNELKNESIEREFKATLSYDELSAFYKRFLDQNHKKHMNYNLQWYRRQSSLLWPAFIVFLIRLKRRIFSKT